MKELNKLIDEVLELDAKATPGPWQITEYEDVICHHTLHNGQKVIGERFRKLPDIQFCALTRTAAPILARELRSALENENDRICDMVDIDRQAWRVVVNKLEAENARLRNQIEEMK